MLQNYHRHCAETFRLSYVHHSSSREYSLERSNLFRIFFSTNTFTTHEASCNENRFNFRKYHLARRVGHKEDAGTKKEEEMICIHRFQSHTPFGRSSICIRCCHVLHATLRLSALRKADLCHTISFCDLRRFSTDV